MNRYLDKTTLKQAHQERRKEKEEFKENLQNMTEQDLIKSYPINPSLVKEEFIKRKKIQILAQHYPEVMPTISVFGYTWSKGLWYLTKNKQIFKAENHIVYFSCQEYAEEFAHHQGGKWVATNYHTSETWADHISDHGAANYQ